MKKLKNINICDLGIKISSKIHLVLFLSLFSNLISSCGRSVENTVQDEEKDIVNAVAQDTDTAIQSRSLLSGSSSQIEFDLIDANTGRVVPGFTNLQDNQKLILKDLPQKLSLQARLATGLNEKSVRIALGNLSRVEAEAPYSLFGDSDGKFKSQQLPLGEFKLAASAHSATRAKGSLLASAQIKLVISNDSGGNNSSNSSSTSCSNGMLNGDARSITIFDTDRVIAPAVCKGNTFVVERCNNGQIELSSFPVGKFETCVVVPATDPTPKNCGSVAHGETTTRLRYQSDTVPGGSSCKSENQTATCNNGILTFSGTFQFSSCVVESVVSQGKMVPVMSDRLEHAGITWFFDKAYPTGQFVTGDKWVVGPVVITKITPEDTDMSDGTDLHGTMLNPTKDTNGLDSRVKGDRYARQYNIARALPKTISGVSSVLSGISISDNYVGKIAVLTVLNSLPEVGSFRPAYYGSAQKQMHNVSSINMSVFARKEATANLESPAKLFNDGLFQHPLLELFTGGASANSSFKAKDQGPHYGREIAKEAVKAGLALNANFPDTEKRALLIRVIQRGLDIYGAMMQGYIPEADGGHRHGRKLHMYIAAKALGSSEILAKIKDRSYQKFQEDQQFRFRDNDGVADWGPSADLAKWHAQTPESWDNTGYRFINGQSAVGLVMVLTFMNGRDEWSNEALFEYVIDTYWPKEKNSPDRGIGSANGIPRATHEMWTKHME